MAYFHTKSLTVGLSILTLALLNGCGSGGGSSTPPTNTQITTQEQPQSNTDQEDNQNTVEDQRTLAELKTEYGDHADSLYSGIRAQAEITPESAILAFTKPVEDSYLEGFSRVFQRLHIPNTTDQPGSISFNNTIDCLSGTMLVLGTLDDTHSGRLSIEATDCVLSSSNNLAYSGSLLLDIASDIEDPELSIYQIEDSIFSHELSIKRTAIGSQIAVDTVESGYHVTSDSGYEFIFSEKSAGRVFTKDAQTNTERFAEFSVKNLWDMGAGFDVTSNVYSSDAGLISIATTNPGGFEAHADFVVEVTGLNTTYVLDAGLSDVALYDKEREKGYKFWNSGFEREAFNYAIDHYDLANLELLPVDQLSTPYDLQKPTLSVGSNGDITAQLPVGVYEHRTPDSYSYRWFVDGQELVNTSNTLSTSEYEDEQSLSVIGLAWNGTMHTASERVHINELTLKKADYANHANGQYTGPREKAVLSAEAAIDAFALYAESDTNNTKRVPSYLERFSVDFQTFYLQGSDKTAETVNCHSGTMQVIGTLAEDDSGMLEIDASKCVLSEENHLAYTGKIEINYQKEIDYISGSGYPDETRNFRTTLSKALNIVREAGYPDLPAVDSSESGYHSQIS